MPDAIVLVGLSGGGKSSIGRVVAERLGRPLVDLDSDIEAREGAHPADLIRERGEAAFREIESAAVERACAIDGAIIASGGGAVLDPLNRWRLWDAGSVVWLDTPDEVLLARLARHDEVRPMLAGDAAERLTTLRATRAPFYRAADVHLDASGGLDDVAGAVIAASRAGRAASRRLFDAEVSRDHPMGPATARVVLGRDLDGSTLGHILAPASAGTPVVVADRRAAVRLPALMAALSDERLLTISAGERNKRLRTVERLLEAASAMGAERGDAWIGVGGGTTTDLVGAAAALYLRGVPFAALPTTWLGMTDAAIGGKVGVDLSAAKNAAGAFWPPVAIVGDVATLRPLPRSRRLDGMAESLKGGLIGDPALWRLVETRGRAALRNDEAARYAIIDRSVQLKLGVVDRDPFEQGERRVLNLGHTIGHALEVESGYRLPHGQAVVLGLRAVTALASRRGAERELPERIDSVVSTLGYQLQRSFDPRVVKGALSSDKKRHLGRQRWILPMAVGRVSEVDDITEAELDTALAVISVDRAQVAAAWTLLLNGPNLGRLGQRQPEIYGSTTLAQVEQAARDHAASLGHGLSAFQSNHEGALIDRLEQRDYDAIVINPGALTHTSYALHDALIGAACPCVEVHISDIMAREEWRRVSVIEPVVSHRILGHGWRGYLEAIDLLHEQATAPAQPQSPEGRP